jgi:hypothetical protein
MSCNGDNTAFSNVTKTPTYFVKESDHCLTTNDFDPYFYSSKFGVGSTVTLNLWYRKKPQRIVSSKCRGSSL